MSKITAADVAAARFRYTAHLNMGALGYGYKHTCEEYPRLSLIDRSYTPSRERLDGGTERTWYVDGSPCKDLDAAIFALLQPPILTEDEQRILDLVPSEFTDLRKLEDELAGVPRPEGGIRPETPHSRVLRWLHSLAEKGLVEYGRQPERGDGKPWSDSVPAHQRWSPTLRRRPTS